MVSEYIGTGETAKLIAKMDAIDQAEREAEREAQQREQAEVESGDVAVLALADLAYTLTAAMFLAAGYHTHKRQWRRKRGKHSSHN